MRIDGLAKYITERIEPVEQRLEDQEKIAERKEAERKAAGIAPTPPRTEVG